MPKQGALNISAPKRAGISLLPDCFSCVARKAQKLLAAPLRNGPYTARLSISLVFPILAATRSLIGPSLREATASSVSA